MMLTRYFVDVGGNYLGGYGGPVAEPFGPDAVEVANAPDDARQIWSGAAWSAKPVEPKLDTIDTLTAALIKKGVLTQSEIDAEKVAL